jgi:hypothetical protein
MTKAQWPTKFQYPNGQYWDFVLEPLLAIGPWSLIGELPADAPLTVDDLWGAHHQWNGVVTATFDRSAPPHAGQSHWIHAEVIDDGKGHVDVKLTQGSDAIDP